MAVFWVVVPCSLAEAYQGFRGPCCLHHQDGGGRAVTRVEQVGHSPQAQYLLGRKMNKKN
jgi:hypothetical protein